MIIRKATIKDAESIAPLLLSAMEDIVYQFINEKNYTKAKAFLLHFIQQENNQYSYQNCFVAIEENQIIGAVNIYDGAKLHELRKPIIKYIQTQFNAKINIEAETQSGEFYIDSLGVNSSFQGKGIGSKMLLFLINKYVNQNQQTLGLLVEKENPKAKKLYLNLGFKVIGNKTLVGKTLEHLQIKPMINYNNKTFRPISNSENGETSNATVFHYKQTGNILTSEYSGGKIKSGHLIGLVNSDGTIEMRYHQINDKKELMTGICTSKPEILSNGKIRLHESWEWTSGDFSKGKSIIEEQ